MALPSGVSVSCTPVFPVTSFGSKNPEIISFKAQDMVLPLNDPYYTPSFDGHIMVYHCPSTRRKITQKPFEGFQ
jgi:hypothetical protein